MPTTARRFRTVLQSAACIVLAWSCSDDTPPADTARQAGDARPAASSAPAATPEPARTPPPPPARPQDVFWDRLSALCGLAYAGFLTVGTEESDRFFGEADLKMHVNACDDDEIHIPFHVSDDRSRTFILRRSADGMTLHHRHLDETGQSAPPDGYGGRTVDQGSAERQEFVVDDATVTMLPESRFNVWAIEIAPGNYFAYELKRVEEERYFRVEFSLDESIDTPAPPWGEEEG